MLCLSLEDLHSHNHRISAKKVFTAGFLYTSFPYPLEWHSSTMARLISEVIQTQKSSTSFCCCFNRICKIVFHPFRLKSPFLRSHRCLFCCRMNESSATTKKKTTKQSDCIEGIIGKFQMRTSRERKKNSAMKNRNKNLFLLLC